MTGKLVIIPTPIGNLEDITLRALRHLEEVDLLAAEDTRRSLQLLNHFEIKQKLISYHEHNQLERGPELLKYIQEGKIVGLVTDAGMPGISDPGTALIQSCIENNLPVEVLPGPTAFVNALVGAGLPTEQFTFIGFLNRHKKERRKELEDLRYRQETLIFYESPHRIKDTVKDMITVLGNRRGAIARELTKKYEEFVRGSLEEIYDHLTSKAIKGEFVFLVEGSDQAPPQEEVDIEGLLREQLDKGLSKKDAVKLLVKEYGLAKNEVYEISLHVEV